MKRRQFWFAVPFGSLCAISCTGLLGDFSVESDRHEGDAAVEASDLVDGATDAASSADVSDASDASDVVTAACGERNAACCATGAACRGVLVCSAAKCTDDPKNCGLAGHDCQSGACVNGACQPFTLYAPDGAITINDFSLLGTSLFTAEEVAMTAQQAGGALRRLSTSTSGSGPVPAIMYTSASPMRLTSVAADATNVFFATDGIVSGSAQGQLLSCSTVVGCGMVPQVILSPAATYPRRLALSATNVVFASSPSGGGSCPNVASPCSPSAFVASGSPIDVAALPNGAFAWTSSAGLFIGTSSALSSVSTGSPRSLSAQGSNLYWSTITGSAQGIAMCSAGVPNLACMPTTVVAVATLGSQVTAVYAEPTRLDFATANGDLWTCPLNGTGMCASGPTRIATGENIISKLVADGGALYYLAKTTATSQPFIRKLVK